MIRHTKLVSSKSNNLSSYIGIHIAFCMSTVHTISYPSDWSHLSCTVLKSFLEHLLFSKWRLKFIQFSQLHGRGNNLCFSSWFLHLVQMSCFNSTVDKWQIKLSNHNMKMCKTAYFLAYIFLLFCKQCYFKSLYMSENVKPTGKYFLLGAFTML